MLGNSWTNALDSIINQDYSHIEIILIDDGSTDNSPLICDSYVAKDKRIKVVHKQNEGVSKARNVGLGLCNGEYCCFIDGDDFLEKHYVSTMFSAMINTNVDIVCCGCRREDFDGNIIWERKTTNTKIFNQKQSIIELFTPTSYVGWPWNKMYKTSIIKENGITFDETLRYCEDEFFVLNYLLHINTCCYVKEQLYHYMENRMSANLKIYTRKEFDRRCLDRQKADEISYGMIKTFHDSEIESTVRARIFTSNIATLSKLLASYNGEKDVLIFLRNNLRKNYGEYLRNKRFPKRFKDEIKHILAYINPMILIYLGTF